MNKREKVGGIWVRKTKNNEQYLSMNIKLDGKEYNLIAFKNRDKKKEKHPHFLIYLSLPKHQKEESEIKNDEL
jgi:uncharacterized protein (DUF736 family)